MRVTKGYDVWRATGLQRLRQQQRADRFLRAATCVLGGVTILVLTCVWLDRLIALPNVARAIGLGAVLACLLGGVLACRARLRESASQAWQTAKALERRFPELEERLLTLATLPLHHGPGPLVAVLAERTAATVRRLPAAKLAWRSRQLWALGLAAVVLLLAFALSWRRPVWAATGLARLLAPYGSTSWCRVDDRSPPRLALGRPYEISLRLSGIVPSKVEIVFDDGRGPQRTEALVQVDEQSGEAFVHTALSVQGPFRYRLRIGDQVVERHVSAGRAPQMRPQWPQLFVQPPPYTGLAERRLQAAGTFECPAASRLTLRAEAVAPLRRAWLELEVPPARSPAPPLRVPARLADDRQAFECNLDMVALAPGVKRMQVVLEGEDGLTSTQRVEVRVLEDPPPALAMASLLTGVEPLRLYTDSTPLLAATAYDPRYGVSRMGFVITLASAWPIVPAEQLAEGIQAVWLGPGAPLGGVAALAAACQRRGPTCATAHVEADYRAVLVVGGLAMPLSPAAAVMHRPLAPERWTVSYRQTPQQLGLRAGERAMVVVWVADNRVPVPSITYAISREWHIYSRTELEALLLAKVSELAGQIEPLHADSVELAHRLSRLQDLVSRKEDTHTAEKAVATSCRTLEHRLREAVTDLPRLLAGLAVEYRQADLLAPDAADLCGVLMADLVNLHQALQTLDTHLSRSERGDRTAIAAAFSALPSLQVQAGRLKSSLCTVRESLSREHEVIQLSQLSNLVANIQASLITHDGTNTLTASSEAEAGHRRLRQALAAGRAIFLDLYAAETAAAAVETPLSRLLASVLVRMQDAAEQWQAGQPAAAADCLAQARACLTGLLARTEAKRLAHAERLVKQREAALARIATLRDLSSAEPAGPWFRVPWITHWCSEWKELLAALDGLPEGSLARVRGAVEAAAGWLTQPPDPQTGNLTRQELDNARLLLEWRQAAESYALAIRRHYAIAGALREEARRCWQLSLLLRQAAARAEQMSVWNGGMARAIVRHGEQGSSCDDLWHGLRHLATAHPLLAAALEGREASLTALAVEWESLARMMQDRTGVAARAAELRRAARLADGLRREQERLEETAAILVATADRQIESALWARDLWRLLALQQGGEDLPWATRSLPSALTTGPWRPPLQGHERDIEQYARDRFLSSYQEEGARYFERLLGGREGKP